MEPWNLKQQFLTEVAKRNGFVNCHAHLDKAFYITRQKLNASMVAMETKWHMSDDIKIHATEIEVEERIRTALDILLTQGVRQTVSFIDAYSAIGQKAIAAAERMQKEYESSIKLLTISQPLGGLLDPIERKWYEAITSRTDIAGGLPSKDRPYDAKNFDVLFSIARNLDKPVHVHIDQENNPHERDTEKLIYYTKKYGYAGRVVAVHAISLAAQPLPYRKKIYRELADLGIAVVVCPSAALSMRQHDDKTAPLHNSIANVPEMIAAGVTVGLGIDNIADFYQPFVDGDMWTEIRMLMEACRYYDFDELIKICTENGKKILAIK